MKHRSTQIVTIFLISILLFSPAALSQGMSRSTGIGLRLSFWNITGRGTSLGVSGQGTGAVVDIGGVGTWLYFFSRVHNNWFLELNLGAAAGVRIQESTFGDGNVEASGIMPVLFGVRYDLFSPRLSGAFQPYLTLGGGPYWTTSVFAKDRWDEEEEEIVRSSLKYGAYLGGGMNIVLASWFTLNFDWKYHFVDFQFQESYSGLEFGLGFSFIWGRKREIFQVEEIKVVVTDLYPAYYRFYNTYPLALVSIKNVAGYPIEVNIRSYLSSFSERPKDSGFICIERGKTKDIPVTAIFGPRLLQVSRREQAVLDIEIEARAGRTDKKEMSAQIMVHNRNAWNGEIDKLGCFITPDDEPVLQLSRRMVNKMKFDDHNGLENFQKAQVIFNELGKMGLRYHRDPNIPFYKDDRVQYAMETINLGNGDCDDLVVLYASLLESLGINTAFVEVQDPQKEIAHVYLMFDSGLSVNQGYLISSNEKRYVSRERASGSKTIWIPVETTLIEHGFEEAWKAGAMAYLQEGILRNGIAEGWVRIIDVE